MYPLLLITLLGSTPANVEVQMLSGDSIVGTLVEFTSDQVAVEREGQRIVVPTDKMTGLSPAGEKGKRTWEPDVWVDLADGTTLIGQDYRTQDGRARIKLAGDRAVELATRDVVAVRLQRANEAALADWDRIRQTEPTGDLLVVRKDTAVDYHRGVLRDVTDSVVHFELDGDVLPVKRAKVLGLLYFQSAGRGLPDAICRVSDTDGSSWSVRSIRLAGNQLEWTTPLGLSMTRPLAEVLRIDFSQGKIVYLSELEPELREWTPYFGSNRDLSTLSQFFAPKTDQGLYSGPMELDGKTYTKGVALHSRTRLVYRLPDKFRRLKAIVGIDDRVRPRGNARLLISGDQRVLLETTLTGREPSRPIDLDLTGVHRLSILVDYGEDLDVSDHVDLGEARVLK